MSWLLLILIVSMYGLTMKVIVTIYIPNKCNQQVICLSFIPLVRLFMRIIQTAASPHRLKIGYMFICTYLLGTVHTTIS